MKEYYAPRPIQPSNRFCHNEIIGYVVDVPTILSDGHDYKDNEISSGLYYNVQFQYRQNTECTYTDFRIDENELFTTYEECKKYVEEQNKKLFASQRKGVELDKRELVDKKIEQAKELLRDTQRIILDSITDGEAVGI